jgi:hypothetical protein
MACPEPLGPAQMALTTHLPAYSQELLTTTSEWFFRESASTPRDLSRYCKANSSIEFRQDDLDLLFGVLVSAGCSHIAAVEVNPARRTIKVTVYHANEGFQEKWSAIRTAPESEFTTGERWSDYDKGALHGGVTEDGQAVLLVYRPKAGATRAYLVNSHGFTWRKPPSDTHLDYSSSIGIVSDDSEHLFYVRSGTKFGRNGEAKVVEAYSIRHLACARAATFGFGDGYHMRNMHIIEHLRLKSPLYVAIETSSFGGNEDERYSPPLVASSDRKVHWNFSNIGGGKNCFVSPDDRHLFHIERDEAMLHHWDLKRLSLKPLGSVRLPGVESSQSRAWLIYGKETTMRDAIDEQIHNVRYSPRCKVITVVTVNSSTVVVNVLSTFNQQLIYHETIRDGKWPNYVPLRIGFNETTGLNIFSMYPTRITRTPQGILRLFGMSAVLISLPDIFKKIKAIENYFDHLSDQLTSLPELVASKQISPTYKFEWKPGVMERNDESAIPLVQGRAVATNAVDAHRQQAFYTNVYAHPNSSWRQDDTPDLRRFFVPHLFSFSYPWASDQRVSVFGAIMKNEYHIISIGPSPSSPNSKIEVIRVLYATDIKISNDAIEHVEFYQSSGRWVLRVYKMGDSYGSYSGAPMPIPRWTIVSPHFLEEDAWYDTFIIHRGAHVTMPGDWSTTPNFAITSTVNFYAYFLPHTVVAHAQVDYGLRTAPAYVLPKHLLWKEYGLRGLKPSNPNAILFGGGRYADTLGPYFRSIYDDRSYDDGHPLFPSTFAMACNADYRAQNTMLVDAFFRRYKQDRNRLLENSATLSCALPLACKARPSATLSFMRHIALYRWVVNDIGAVEVKLGATKSRHTNEVDLDNKWQIWRVRAERIWQDVRALVWAARPVVKSEPNQRQVTLPLPGFCSFNNRLYKPPPVAESSRSFGDCFWEFVLATTLYSKDQNHYRWEGYLNSYVASTSRGPGSPFTRLVEEIVDMKDRDLQLSYLNVAWLEKLLAWKMRRFALWIYLTRTALPMLVLFAIHLAVGILLTGGDGNVQNRIGWWVILLVTIELAASCFIMSVKLRQAYRIPRLFFGSIFNYVDTTALCLGIAMFFQVATKHAPPRAFLGFSTLLIWIAAILMLRIHKPVGMLLLLLTETIQGIFSFLVLLFFIVLGRFVFNGCPPEN